MLTGFGCIEILGNKVYQSYQDTKGLGKLYLKKVNKLWDKL